MLCRFRLNARGHFLSTLPLWSMRIRRLPELAQKPATAAQVAPCLITPALRLRSLCSHINSNPERTHSTISSNAGESSPAHLQRPEELCRK